MPEGKPDSNVQLHARLHDHRDLMGPRTAALTPWDYAEQAARLLAERTGLATSVVGAEQEPDGFLITISVRPAEAKPLMEAERVDEQSGSI